MPMLDHPAHDQTSDAVVVHRVSDGIGWIQLNRPKALNAVNIEMVASLRPLLDEWRDRDDVRSVVLTGNGRAFCAGGDIRSVYDFNKAGQSEKSIELFRTEYELNLAIHHFSKPYVSILDGLTMGGGMGLSMHGSHRVATENTVMAMPETAIGFFPDVGAGWFLPRAKGMMGLYLALTSNHISAADALYAGLATHYVKSDDVPALMNALKQNTNIDEVLQGFHTQPDEESELEKHADIINSCFNQPSLDAIFQALEENGSNFALQTLETLKTRSPLSMKVGFEILSTSQNRSIEDVLDQDLKHAKNFAISDEFMEGNRAAVVDKDRKPVWPSGNFGL